MSKQQTDLTIDIVMAQIRTKMNLSRETERELLLEIRDHLEDALETAVSQGQDPTAALQRIAAEFGVEDVGQALQDVHAPWESADAVLACIIPVLGAVVLRWLVFAPDGSAIGWQAILNRPAFWIVALVALIVPILNFPRWRYAAISWSIFWVITMIFILLPNIQNW